MHLETQINHQIQSPLPADNTPLVAPLYHSVKYTFEKFSSLKDLFGGDRDGYFYSRYRNPTVRQLENLLAQIQGTEDGLATSSGVGAIATTLFSCLKSGDRILYFIESYRPTRTLIETTLSKFGVIGVKLSLDQTDRIKEELAHPDTRMVIWESPTNPQLKIPNSAFIVQQAKAHGVTTVLDNTFGGFHKNKDLDVDIYIHSLTKYAGGHGDAMGGVILSSRSIIKSIHQDSVEFGNTMDPQGAFLILRGMKTYKLRYQRQAENAKVIATWLKSHPLVKDVFYPGLRPDLAMEDGGTVLMFNLKKAVPLEIILDKLNLFKLSASLGSTESLVAPALYFYGSDLSVQQQQQASLDETSLRLSLGIEHPDDLIADLEGALEAAQALP